MTMSAPGWRIARIWDDSNESCGDWEYPYGGKENQYATRAEAEAAARRHIEGDVIWSTPPCTWERNYTNSEVAHYEVSRLDGSKTHSASMVVHMDPSLREIEEHTDMPGWDCPHAWRETTKVRGAVTHRRAVCVTCGLRRHQVVYPEAALLRVRGRKCNYVEYRRGWWKLLEIQGEKAAKIGKKVAYLVERNADLDDLLDDIKEYIQCNQGAIYYGAAIDFVVVNNAGTRLKQYCHTREQYCHARGVA